MRVRRVALTLCAFTAFTAFGGVAFGGVAVGGVAVAGPAAKPDCSGLPAHRGVPVVDAANVVSPEAEAWLDVDLAMYHATGHEAIVAATVTNLGGDDVSSYATRLFDCWGIGDAKSDNGVLILVAMRERRVRIELGSGLAGRLTDGQLEAAIATMKAPLRSNDVGAALRGAAATVVRDLGGTLPDTKSANPGSVPSMIGPGDTAGDAPDDLSDATGDSPDAGTGAPNVVTYPVGPLPSGGYGPFDSADEPGSGTTLVVVAFVFGLIIMAVRIVSAIGSSGGGGPMWRGGFPGYGGGHWGTPSILHRGTWHDTSPPDVFSGGGGGGAGGGGFGGSSGSSGSFGGGSSGGGGASGSW